MHDHAISATALYIAEGLTILSRDPQIAPLIPESDRRLAQEAVRLGSSATWIRFLGTKLGRSLYTGVCQTLSPGVWLHHVLRKRLIDQTVRQALAHGFESVVVLAAGFDPLCSRLHRAFSSVTFVEVDLPKTQAVKRHSLGGVGPNLHFVSTDLAQVSVGDALASLQNRPQTKTIVVIEGLSMYLTEPQIKNLLSGIAALPDQEIRIILTFFKPNSRGDVAFETNTPLGRAWLRLKKEPYLWGIAAESIGPFLETLGFRSQGVYTTADLASGHGLKNRPLAIGELITVADRIPRERQPSP